MLEIRPTPYKEIQQILFRDCGWWYLTLTKNGVLYRGCDSKLYEIVHDCSKDFNPYDSEDIVTQIDVFLIQGNGHKTPAIIPRSLLKLATARTPQV